MKKIELWETTTQVRGHTNLLILSVLAIVMAVTAAVVALSTAKKIGDTNSRLESVSPTKEKK